MEEFIRRSEHDEFAKRMEDEHHRQSKRITEVEEAVKQYGALTVAVERMACNMQSMLTEQKAQGERLGVLESRDGEMWRKVTGYILTTILGIVVGCIFNKLGM